MSHRVNNKDSNEVAPKPLSSFLGKYDKLPTPKRHLKEAIEKYIGIKNKITDVAIQNGVLYIKANASIKQKLFIEKVKLLQFMKENIPLITIKDIR